LLRTWKLVVSFVVAGEDEGEGRGAMRTNGISVRPAERIRSSKKIDTREATAAADTSRC